MHELHVANEREWTRLKPDATSNIGHMTALIHRPRHRQLVPITPPFSPPCYEDGGGEFMTPPCDVHGFGRDSRRSLSMASPDRPRMGAPVSRAKIICSFRSLANSDTHGEGLLANLVSGGTLVPNHDPACGRGVPRGGATLRNGAPVKESWAIDGFRRPPTGMGEMALLMRLSSSRPPE